MWLLILQTCVYADVPLATTPTPIKNDYIVSELTTTTYDHLTPEQQKTVAESWHLSVADYTHYLELMQNTPNGFYYKDKNLDPSWILGFNATTDPERDKYVVIAIQNERLRVAKELAFQHAFDRLQRELYPDLKPIKK